MNFIQYKNNINTLQVKYYIPHSLELYVFPCCMKHSVIGLRKICAICVILSSKKIS